MAKKSVKYIKKSCINCGKELTVSPKKLREGRGKFCSLLCKHEWWRGRHLGRKYPNNGNGTYKECRACGKSFYVAPCNTNQKYCSRECRLKFISMENSPTWRGGIVTMDGYTYLKVIHPNRNKAGYVAEHRLVMERVMGRLLSPHELVHHKNGIRDDNRPENLVIVYNKKHYGTIECPHCRKEFVIK